MVNAQSPAQSLYKKAFNVRYTYILNSLETCNYIVQLRTVQQAVRLAMA